MCRPKAKASRETWEARAHRPGVAWADQNTVTSVVSQAALSADIVVVMLHFGLEYHADPSASQRELAHAAIAAGAALVVGSHPHLLQEVEEYGGGLIAYSLGNFVFDRFGGGLQRLGHPPRHVQRQPFELLGTRARRYRR
jgi:poly-gamma-glutamate synthesis protein (capsule biosynthesis protein)